MSDLSRIVVLTDRANNNEKVYSLAIDKGVIVKNNNLWGNSNWNKSGGFLTLDTVLEEIPALAVKSLKLQLEAPSVSNYGYLLNLLNYDNSIISSVDLTPLRTQLSIDLGDVNDIFNKTKDKIATTEAVGNAIDAVVGWTITKIDEL